MSDQDWMLTDERIAEVLAKVRALPCPQSAYCPDDESSLRFDLRIIGEKALAELQTLRARCAAMEALCTEAELWEREFIGEETSYDLRLKAAIDTYRAAKAQETST